MLFNVGCANKSGVETAMLPKAPTAQQEAVKEETKEVVDEKTKTATKEAVKEVAKEDDAVIIPKAESMLGVMYKYGGNTPAGFDCSGFVQWVYKHAGVKLPRSAKDQARVGVAVKSKKDIQVGDIVTFKRKRVYHTGIYLGEGKFIHSPRTNKDIRISDMSVSYFSRYYTGTRRVADLGPEEKAAAQELLEEHGEKQVASRGKK